MPRRTRNLPRSPRPLDIFLRRRRRLRGIGAAAALLLAALLVFADRSGWLLHETSDWAAYHDHEFHVIRVVDGDTLDLDARDGSRAHTRVRFWGVDAPETAKPQEGAPAEPYADEAWSMTRRLCEGRRVKVRLDPRQSRDRYDRLLVYLELEDGTIINEQLLLHGLAEYVARFPHQHLERYELLEKQARFEKKGIWTR